MVCVDMKMINKYPKLHKSVGTNRVHCYNTSYNKLNVFLSKITLIPTLCTYLLTYNIRINVFLINARILETNILSLEATI